MANTAKEWRGQVTLAAILSLLKCAALGTSRSSIVILQIHQFPKAHDSTLALSSTIPRAIYPPSRVKCNARSTGTLDWVLPSGRKKEELGVVDVLSS